MSTKVDHEMTEFIDSRCDDLGISSAEFVRRILDLYKESVEGALACPSCMGLLDFSSEVEHERY